MIINKKNITFEVDDFIGCDNGWEFWDHVSNDLWEPHTFDILYKFLDKEHSYLDIGAWIGPTVLFGSQLAKKCYAFEPDPTAFAVLNKNLNLNNKISNVQTSQLAISNINGKLKMGSNSDNGDSMSSLLFNKNSSWEVNTTTLKECFNMFNITDCNFIKMDVEGGESLILPEAKDFFKIHQPTFYLALHTQWMDDKSKFLEMVKDFCSIYKNLYNNKLEKINIDDIDYLPTFTEILLTNKDL
mgnify:CR=1 FL=1